MNKMKHIIKQSTLAAFFMLLTCWTTAQTVAFPGAEGYGRFATGGRGEDAEVVIVTNLDDDADNPPEGSFRWALQQAVEEREDPIIGTYLFKLPLTVVFEVGGIIELDDELRVNRNNLTVAGQTAPGDGICFRGHTVNFSGSHNVIIQHLRFRPGDEQGEVTSAFRIENGGNFIIDHCSMSWAIEETTHFSSCRDITIQWCIVSESLFSSFHPKGNRGFATQWGGEYASYHHNLLAHHVSRMPRINGSNDNDIESLVDYRNNVHYNWRSTSAFYGGEWEGTNGQGFCHTNVVNNYFKPGPGNVGTPIFARPSLNRQDVPLDGYAGWYFDGNVMVGDPEITADNWLGVSGATVGGIENIRSDDLFVQSDGVLEQYDTYTQSATDAYQSVLAYSGAILPVRDAIDERVIAEVREEIPIERYEFQSPVIGYSPLAGVVTGIIDTPVNLVPDSLRDEMSAWDVYATTNDAPLDTDRDGMPDTWEIANGLDPMDYSDFSTITETGYSNLELYIHQMAVTSTEEIELAGKLLKVFPNPSSGQLNIQSEYTIVQVELYNLSGQLVRTFNGSLINSIDVEGLPAGMYVLKAATQDHQLLSKKVMIVE